MSRTRTLHVCCRPSFVKNCQAMFGCLNGAAKDLRRQDSVETTERAVERAVVSDEESPAEEDEEEKCVYDEMRDEQLELLLKRQARALPTAKEELQIHGRKRGHWAWWAFPTEKPGLSEPFPPTKVTVETARELVRRAPAEWREVLELIATLVDRAGDISDVVPPIDHGRIIYFIRFWKDLEDSPIWLIKVCKRLDSHFACPVSGATGVRSGVRATKSAAPSKPRPTHHRYI